VYNKIVENLKIGGYIPLEHIIELFKQKTQTIILCLTIDDFGIKSVEKNEYQHLLNHLNKEYKIIVDWGRFLYGLHLNWDYGSTLRTVELKIPNYAERSLPRFKHIKNKYAQHSSHPFTPSKYGAKQQHKEPISRVLLTSEDKKWIEEVAGGFLYYARAIDSTMLLPIGSIVSAKSAGTIKNLKKRIHHLLDYAATQPAAKIKYAASKMHLWAQSDVSYMYK